MNFTEFKEKILNNPSEVDWKLHESNMETYYTIATLKEDLAISLRHRSEYVNSNFIEKWANNWPAKRATSSYIDFCFNGEIIFQKLVVSIDGSRGLILCPSMIIENQEMKGYKYSREDYNIAKIIEKLFSCHDKNVDMVIDRENWKIED